MTVRVRILSLLVAAGLAVAAGAAPSAGLEEEGFTLTDQETDHEQDFGPIPLQNPGGTVTDPTLDDCKSLPSHMAVSIGVDVKSDKPSKIAFSVSWPAPPEANDLDVYFFQDDGTHITDSAGSTNPEAFNVAGLPNGTYWVCVANFSGVNTGFTISAKMTFVNVPDFPTLPPDATPSRTSPPKTLEPTETDEPGAASGPVVTPEAIETPGADGGAKDGSLVAFSGGKQASPSEGGRSGVRVALLALTGLLIAGGAGIVALRIRRDMSSP